MATTPESGPTGEFDPNLFPNLFKNSMNNILKNTWDGGVFFFTSLWNLRGSIPSTKDIEKWRNKMMYEYGQDNNMEAVIDVVIQKLKSQDPQDLSQLETIVHVANKRKFFNEVDEFLSQIINHDPPLIQESYQPVYKKKPLGSVQYSVHKNKNIENNDFFQTPDVDYTIPTNTKKAPITTPTTTPTPRQKTIGVTNNVRVYTPYKTISEQMKDVENLFESIDMERKQKGKTKDTVHRDSIRINNKLDYVEEDEKVDPVIERIQNIYNPPK